MEAAKAPLTPALCPQARLALPVSQLTGPHRVSNSLVLSLPLLFQLLLKLA